MELNFWTILFIVALSVVSSLITVYFFSKNRRQGAKLLLLELLKRYVLNIENALDPAAQGEILIKKDEETKCVYQNELEQICGDSKLLLQNESYLNTLKKNPELTLLFVALQRESVILGEKTVMLDLDRNSVRQLIRVYDWLKKEFDHKYGFKISSFVLKAELDSKFKKKFAEPANILSDIDRVVEMLRQI